MTDPIWWPAGSATGGGPLPGTDVGEAQNAVAGELPELPFQPELPARGVGADPVGRSIGLLVDIFGEVVPSGWRISRRPGVDHRRATDFRRWDLDALAERLAGAPRLKIQLLGPWSLAARLELPSGNPAIGDPGAVADLAGSLAEGVRQHLAEIGRRLPDSVVAVQIDEPDLPRVLAGAVPTASGFGTVRSVPLDTVRTGLTQFVDGLGERPTIAAGIPAGQLWDLVWAAGFGGAVAGFGEISGRSTAVLDAVGEAVQADRRLLVELPPDTTAEAATRALVAGWQQIGFPVSAIARSLTPMAAGRTDGTLATATTAMKTAAEAGSALLDPPDNWL